MALRSSAENWIWIESLDPQKQRDILQWQLQAREPIRRFADIKLGDHLVTKGSLVPGSSASLLPSLFEYEHHCLCIGFDSESPIIIHYFNTPANACSQMRTTVSFGSGTSLGKAGIIQETILKEENGLVNEDKLKAADDYEWAMARVVWPDELRRYSVKEVIKRAERRKNENFFDLKNNNCESFVMWCLCGLNITLQVTLLRKTLCVGSTALVKAGFRGIQQGVKATVKKGAQFVDDIFAHFTGGCLTETAVGKIIKDVLPDLGLDGGMVLSVLFEIGGAVKDIHDAWKKWDDRELIQSLDEFVKEVVGILLGAFSRCGGSIAGMMVLGGLVGAVLGVFGGHVIAKIIKEYLFSYPTLCPTSEKKRNTLLCNIISFEKDKKNAKCDAR